MQSFWSNDPEQNLRSSLTKNIKADAVVIGAGMAGILCAYRLMQNGVNTVVLEASRIGSGQTKNTTAKITSQHGLIYSKIINNFGLKAAHNYALANTIAIDEYEKIVKKNKMDCDFKRASSFLYTKADNDKINDEYKAAKELGINANLTDNTELPFEIKIALEFKNQGMFNPIKFLMPLADKMNIYENTKVTQIIDNKVVTEKGSVTAKYIIIASHFPFVNFPKMYFMRMHQERSYVLAIKTDKKIENMYYGIDADGLTFRGYKDMILLGGYSHRTGECIDDKYQLLKNNAKIYYPEYTEVAKWSAQDCMTLDSIPYIGRFTKNSKNYFLATGFNKWGMTGSMVSSMIISDLITGRKNNFISTFSSERKVTSIAMKNLMKEMGQSVKSLTAQKFVPTENNLNDIPLGTGKIVEYKGKKAGVYKRNDGKIFAVSSKCPHLGCQLEWNNTEKSWDCPCHGSRFDYRGNLIDNPAQKSNKLK